MLLAVIAAVLAYRKATASGRSGWLWVIIAVAVFIGTQLLIGVAAGVLIVSGMALFGWSESAFTTFELPINIFAIAGALAATWELLKFLDRVPQAESAIIPPPPPPTFPYGTPPSE